MGANLTLEVRCNRLRGGRVESVSRHWALLMRRDRPYSTPTTSTAASGPALGAEGCLRWP